ncbi:hypothetical protein L6164_000604 [Bauhinia variegata]|uniref:Uncharacterized protein n=1 Tax=Bauhinia variegata TaxID=167791 RepID=A0ACB9Q704_BAUVA|nr:hypothetical protein L6164_000604 [Bauhinia variegata]
MVHCSQMSFFFLLLILFIVSYKTSFFTLILFLMHSVYCLIAPSIINVMGIHQCRLVLAAPLGTPAMLWPERRTHLPQRLFF